MPTFAEGLLSGFSVVEQLADRRERRRLADEELGLRRAADSRAEAAFRTQQQIISDTQLRQQRTDAAANALARAQSVGLENLAPEEIDELENQAAFNPQIGAALQDLQLGRRDTEAIRAIAGLARRPGLGAVTDTAVAQQPAQTLAGPRMTPEEFVSTQEGSELAPPVTGGTRRVHRTYLRGLIPGFQVPAGMSDPRTGIVELPEDLIQRLEEAKGLPMVQRQQVIDQARAVLGDGNFSATVAAARAAAAQARDKVDTYRGFADPDDEAGADLRRLAAEDPLAITLQFAGDFNTLKAEDPNTLALVSREMAPVVTQAVEQARARVAALPVVNGRVEMTKEARAAMRDFNATLSVMQNMSDEFRPEMAANIRAGAMPVGNVELAGRMRGIMESTPPPGQPESAAQLQANVTIARRAVASVADGTRNLTTKQVESLAWLAKRGYITPDGFEQFLTTGTFQQPRDRDFFSHDPDKILYGPNGEVLYIPPKPQPKPGDISAWADDQQEVIHDMFDPGPGATPGQAEKMKRMENAFYITLSQNPTAFWGADVNVNDLRQLSRSEIALLIERFIAFNETRSAWDESIFHGAGVAGLFRGKFDTQTGSDGELVNVTNFDEIAKKFDIPTPPLRIPKANIDALRMGLAASDDPEQRIQARTLLDHELEDMAIREKQNQGPPPPLTTGK